MAVKKATPASEDSVSLHDAFETAAAQQNYNYIMSYLYEAQAALHRIDNAAAFTRQKAPAFGGINDESLTTMGHVACVILKDRYGFTVPQDEKKLALAITNAIFIDTVLDVDGLENGAIYLALLFRLDPKWTEQLIRCMSTLALDNDILTPGTSLYASTLITDVVSIMISAANQCGVLMQLEQAMRRLPSDDHVLLITEGKGMSNVSDLGSYKDIALKSLAQSIRDSVAFAKIEEDNATLSVDEILDKLTLRDILRDDSYLMKLILGSHREASH